MPILGRQRGWRMDAIEWLHWWQLGAYHYGKGVYAPPPQSDEGYEPYETGHTVAQKAWVAEKRGKLFP